VPRPAILRALLPSTSHRRGLASDHFSDEIAKVIGRAQGRGAFRCLLVEQNYGLVERTAIASPCMGTAAGFRK
jgi:hypothetical protein